MVDLDIPPVSTALVLCRMADLIHQVALRRPYMLASPCADPWLCGHAVRVQQSACDGALYGGKWTCKL
jgi:hypothetical protein